MVPIIAIKFIQKFLKCHAIQPCSITDSHRKELECERRSNNRKEKRVGAGGALGRLDSIPREGNGTPLHYSCLENPMDGGAWWAAVHGVAKNWTRLSLLFPFMHWRRKWQATPMFLPGESQGRGTLVGCRLWGRTESDTTEVI